MKQRDVVWLVIVLVLAGLGASAWRFLGAQPETERNAVYVAVVDYLWKHRERPMFVALHGQDCPTDILRLTADGALLGTEPQPRSAADIRYEHGGSPDVYTRDTHQPAELVDLGDIRWEPHGLFDPPVATVQFTLYCEQSARPFEARIVRIGGRWQETQLK